MIEISRRVFLRFRTGAIFFVDCLTSLCLIGNNTNRELSAVSKGSGCMSPAISFVLNSDICMSPRSLSSA